MSAPNITKRGFSNPIGNVTQRITSRLCGKYKHLKHGRLFTEWRQIFPDEVGILYQPVRLSQEKLTVKTSSTQAALLTYFAPSMVEKINQYLGSDVVRSIQAQQGFVAKNVQKSCERTLSPLSDENKQHLEGITDNKLQQALEQWGKWLETRR